MLRHGIILAVLMGVEIMNNDEMLIEIQGMFDKKVDEVKKEVKDVKNHMGVIAESLRSDIKAVAEGHGIIDKKIDNLSQEINYLKKDMSLVKDYVVGVDRKLNEHEIILKRVK